MERSLVLRAESSPAIGLGHVMRCLALAEAWRDSGGRAIMVGHIAAPSVLERCRASGIERNEAGDAESLAALATRHGARVVVLDGYGFDAAWQRALQARGLKCAVVDDYAHLPHYAADMVINPNLGAEKLAYPAAPGTQYLLGSRYALLRREFLYRRDSPRVPSEEGPHVLVTMGGSDPDNCTLRVVDAIAGLDIPGVECVVVIGGANPHAEAVRNRAEALQPTVRVVNDVEDMSTYMAWADVAVSAAGSTSWELAFMGVPALLIVLSENQANIAAELDQAGAAHNLGWGSTLTPETIRSALEGILRDPRARLAMASRGRALVDGRGADRVGNALARLAAE